MVRFLNFVLIKVPNKCLKITFYVFSLLYISIIRISNNIKLGTNSQFNGFPRFIINTKGSMIIGNKFRINSGSYFNPIGRNQRCIFYVGENAKLKIENNVGMSSIAIFCEKSISIGNNVRIGGNVVIYDTDFHSLNYNERVALPEKKDNVKRINVEIGDNVFIGAHSLILKGVTIGDNSIIGSGSVVSKSIPKNEIWAGNPVRFIRVL